MGQTVGPPIARRRQAVTTVVGASYLVAALVASVLASSEPVRAQATNWPRSITIGTASPGGVYDGYGEALARILSRALQIEVTAQVTQGGAQNIVLMEKKEALLGFVTTGLALQGWNGTDWAKGTRYRSMRVIFPMYDTAFHFAMKSQPSAKETIPTNIDRNTMLPLHPGALRYYRAAGIAVPPGAVVGN